jgi:hypothetical protein
MMLFYRLSRILLSNCLLFERLKSFLFYLIFMLTLYGFQLPRFLQISFVSPSNCVVVNGRPNIAGNVLQLGEVAEIEGQMLGLAQKFNRITAVEFSTKPAILPNCC